MGSLQLIEPMGSMLDPFLSVSFVRTKSTTVDSLSIARPNLATNCKLHFNTTMPSTLLLVAAAGVVEVPTAAQLINRAKFTLSVHFVANFELLSDRRPLD